MLGIGCNQWAGYECTKCKVNLRHITKNNVRMNLCISCIVERGRQWQADNHEHFLEYMKSYGKKYRNQSNKTYVEKYQRENKIRGEKRAEKRRSKAQTK